MTPTRMCEMPCKGEHNKDGPVLCNKGTALQTVVEWNTGRKPCTQPSMKKTPSLTLPKTHLARVKHWRSPCLCFLCVSFFWCPLSIQFLNRLSWSKNMGIFMHVNTHYLAGVFSWPKNKLCSRLSFLFLQAARLQSIMPARFVASSGHLRSQRGSLGEMLEDFTCWICIFLLLFGFCSCFSQKLVSISFPAPDVDSLLGFSWGLDSWLLHSLSASQARSHWTAWVILIVARQFASSSQMRWGALCGWCRLDFSWTAPWHETAPRRGSEMRIASRVRNNKHINVPFRSFMLWYLRGLVLLAVSYISSIAK